MHHTPTEIVQHMTSMEATPSQQICNRSTAVLVKRVCSRPCLPLLFNLVSSVKVCNDYEATPPAAGVYAGTCGK